MKHIITVVTAILLLTACQNQTDNSELTSIKKEIKMEQETTKAEDAVKQIFIATDNKDWSKVESTFADKVVLDYESMSGQPSAELTPQQITDAWKTILPGFTFTHHQVGNFISNINGNKADVFCYGTATHYLEDKNGNVWTVVGTYNFEVVKNSDKWQVSKMKFNYKYQDGNTALPQKAMEILK